MTTLEQKIASLPKARQATIKTRADALVADEMALRELREAHADKLRRAKAGTTKAAVRRPRRKHAAI